MVRAAVALTGKPGQKTPKRLLATALLGIVSFVALFVGSGVASRSAAAVAGSDPAVVSLAQLPGQGQQTYRLILQGGPFPHEKDGAVFGNYERQLPPARRGYYHEYTVDTPGAHDRGARRIVCGGYRRTAPDTCYYTGNHYSSFKKIVP